jgi:hypothetical protein
MYHQISRTMAYQQQAPGYGYPPAQPGYTQPGYGPPGQQQQQQQQQQTVIINQQPTANSNAGQPQNVTEWSSGICGCCEDCSSCEF